MKCLGSLIAALAVACTPAYAQWDTAIEEDPFTGENVAVMIGASYDTPYVLYFRCSGSEAEFRILDPDDKSDVENQSATAEMIVQTDTGHRWEGRGPLIRHNTQYVGVAASDQGGITKLVQEIGKSKSRIRFGYRFANDVNDSSSMDAIGSSAAAKKFMQACDL